MNNIMALQFTSVRSAHAHVLKHVFRTSEADPDESTDPERWKDLIDVPWFEEALDRRRAGVLGRLRKVPGCPAGAGVTGAKGCADCQDHDAWRLVTSEVNEVMTQYLLAAATALDNATTHPDKSGPRLLAYADSSAGGAPVTILETFDHRHVFVAARVERGEVRVLTCYRDLNRTMNSHHLELYRKRASHRRAGTLVNFV